MIMRSFIISLQLLSITLAFSVSSQSLNLATGSQDQPIEITADNGIEWQRDKQVMIASGAATAIRGNARVEADKLLAYYEKDKTGKSSLSKLDAIGKVKIMSPTQKLTGDIGSYDLTRGILVMTGKRVRLISGENKITADKQIEFYEKKEMVVARKNAVANHNGKFLRANTIVGFFYQDKQGKTKLRRIQAFDEVKVVTKTESIWAEKGIYDVSSGIATLDGNIRITRDGNQLNGESAIINLNTGISKLLTGSEAQSNSSKKKSRSGKRRRVRGYLRPKNN